ncbi:MAG: hypothetical protein K2H64_09735 [Desulfovibrio sp.]|nr:hypothetical protein [Desulfovibrio sp.]
MNYPCWEYEKFVCECFLFKSVMESDDIQRTLKLVDTFIDYFCKITTEICRVDEDTMRAWFRRCVTDPVNLRNFVMDSSPWNEALARLEVRWKVDIAKFCKEMELEVNQDILLIMARDEGLIRGEIVVVPDEKFLEKYAEG